MDVVAVNPAQLPVTLAIGTGRDQGRAYNYRFVDEINMYVCDHQTTTKLSPPLAIRILVLHVK